MRILLFANSDWYLFNFRRSLALTLRKQGNEVLLVSPPGPYGERLTELGLEWIAAPMVRSSLNPIREIILIRWLTRLVRSRRIDLVHGFTIKCAVYGSLAARLAGNVARVVAVAGLGFTFTSNSLKAGFLRPFVSRAMKIAFSGDRIRLILQNTDDVRHFSENRLIKESWIRLIPGSGVDCGSFTPRPPRDTSGIRVLIASRMLWDKGIMEYIQAARIIRRRRQDISFLMAGEPDPGNPSSVSEQQLHDWVKEGLVEWLGHVDDMPTLLHSVDIAVLPSYREGTPKSLLEAAACGLPMITTDAPGCREVVDNGVDGLLIPVKDSEALATAIERLASDRGTRLEMGARARAKAVAKFDSSVIESATIAVYSEVQDVQPQSVLP